MLELYTKQPVAVAGSKLQVTFHVIGRVQKKLILKAINWDAGTDTLVQMPLGFDSLYTFEHIISLPSNLPVTQPYWLEKPADGATFHVENRNLIGLPETPDSVLTRVLLNICGEDISLNVPLSYKRLDPLKGDVVEQLRIVPSVTLEFNSSILVAKEDGSLSSDVHIHAFQGLKQARLIVRKDESDTLVADVRGIDLTAGSDTVINIFVEPKSVLAGCRNSYRLNAEVTLADGSDMKRSLHLIQYSHIPTLQYFTAPSTLVIHPDWKKTVKRVGYVEGAGDNIPSVLNMAGIEVTLLKESDFSNPSTLSKFDAIVTGIRAVNVEKKMVVWMPLLLKYAEKGGTLIVLYNTLQDPVTSKLGPYPITLSSKRVTEENARVDFNDPEMRILNYPNKITSADFEGWVQERGLYFPIKWDDNYQSVFSMHDEGEQPLKGSTLFAKVGKGNYIYTSLSFSRQLPAGNIGAIRLMMNMLSIGK
jgi:hypothetical protein